jgi:hypothetical protein
MIFVNIDTQIYVTEINIDRSLCNGSSIYVTAGSNTGTDLFELHVGWSAIAPEFQGHPGNVFVVAIYSQKQEQLT